MLRVFPAEFFGVDLFAGDALRDATEAAKSNGLSNITFIISDAAKLTMDNFAFDDSTKFDMIMAHDVVHDQADPQAGGFAFYGLRLHATYGI